MGTLEENIRSVEDTIDELNLEQIMDSLSEDDVKDNSMIARRMLNFPDVDAPFRRFVHVLGAWEIGIGDTMQAMQQEINQSLQVLQVLTGAEDKIALMEFSRRLKKVERRIPSMVRQIAQQLYGQAYANQLIPSFPALPGTAPNNGDAGSTPNPPAAPVYYSYDWSDAAKATGGPAPVQYGGIVLTAGKAERAGHNQNAIGVATSVDSTAKTVKVAINGQTITGFTATELAGLNAGDELIPVSNSVTGRYLITLAEAGVVPIVAGSPIKVLARVIQNNADIRAIVVVDQALRPMPVL